ncbi:MAG: PAS domain-containing protein [Candidatus Izimaplasma sp.]|nr:PAS domain-containing protein [Candidatus Izimaplasma bacterium]
METFSYDKEHINQLNTFMKHLEAANNSKEKKALFEDYKKTIRSVTAIDLFFTEFYGQKTTKSMADIKQTADKFVNLFYQSLESKLPEYTHRYFFLCIEENDAVRSLLDTLKSSLKKDTLLKSKSTIKKTLEKAADINLLFEKRENILFSSLEDIVPSSMPLKVLWSLHNDGRNIRKKLLNLINASPFDKDAFQTLIGEYYFLIYGILQKHELILLPIAHQVLTKRKLNLMVEEVFDHGFAFITPKPPQKTRTKDSKSSDSLFDCKTGYLSMKQVGLILNHIPLDITYVNEDNKVQYFNDRKERHFPRSPSIIGRLVENCHPPKSVHIVKKIVDDFKQGRRDFAEFYIHFKESYLYITYYAVRDKEKTYKGVLEVSQDITHINALSGEKRLLDETDQMYNRFADYYDEVFPLNSEKVSFLDTQLKAEGTILDIGCATGETAIALAAKKRPIKAIDLNEKMIELANKKDMNNIDFSVQNMIDISENNIYSGIYIVGNTLVHAKNEKAIKQLLESCYRALKDSGKIIIQIINYDRILNQYITSLPTIKRDSITFERSYDFKETNIIFNTKLETPKETLTMTQQLYPIQSKELFKLMRQIGYTKIKSYGSFDTKPYVSDSSFHLIVVASK